MRTRPRPRLLRASRRRAGLGYARGGPRCLGSPFPLHARSGVRCLARGTPSPDPGGGRARLAGDKGWRRCGRLAGSLSPTRLHPHTSFQSLLVSVSFHGPAASRAPCLQHASTPHTSFQSLLVSVSFHGPAASRVPCLQHAARGTPAPGGGRARSVAPRRRRAGRCRAGACVCGGGDAGVVLRGMSVRWEDSVGLLLDAADNAHHVTSHHITSHYIA